MSIREYDRGLEAKIDEKDRQIMNLLQQDGRMTLKEIGKKVSDAAQKLVDKWGVFFGGGSGSSLVH